MSLSHLIRNYLPFWLFVISWSLTQSRAWGLPGGFMEPPALYNASDKIVLLDSNSINNVILNSNYAWLVEFYSSWCGHCQHFAPTFKKLALEVQDWKDVIKVGAIDCAQEINMVTCREYEVMGYPTMKFIPPKSQPKDIQKFEDTSGRTVSDIKKAMVEFVKKISTTQLYSHETEKWPNLSPIQSGKFKDLWPENSDASHIVIFISNNTNEDAISGMMLSSTHFISKLSNYVPLLRVDKESSAMKELSQSLNIHDDEIKSEFILVVSRNDERILSKLGDPSKNINDNIHQLVNVLSNISEDDEGGDEEEDNEEYNNKEQKKIESMDIKKEANPKAEKIQILPKATHTESEIKRRRYTVYLADLERTIFYSLSHEVSQHQMIAGDSLKALIDYVEVLIDFFPFRTGRETTRQFLVLIRNWILSHDDAIRGEDLAKKIGNLQKELSCFDDLPINWMACQGSEAKYGGYPCGLWTLFHTLTVQQRASIKAGNPKRVLRTMRAFIKNFFSCLECARHFDQATEEGKAIERDVNSLDDSVLWLWQTHNKVNRRLSGDITDDPVFPKEKFPNRQHCTDCYDSRLTGSDLWKEFRIDNILHFLTKEIYHDISMEGLTRNTIKQSSEDHHELILPLSPKSPVDKSQENLRHKESLDIKNFSKFENDQSSGYSSFYLIIGILIIVLFLKFVAKVKFSPCFTWFTPRPRYKRNPLLGKV